MLNSTKVYLHIIHNNLNFYLFKQYSIILIYLKLTGKYYE